MFNAGIPLRTDRATWQALGSIHPTSSLESSLISQDFPFVGAIHTEHTLSLPRHEKSTTQLSDEIPGMPSNGPTRNLTSSLHSSRNLSSNDEFRSHGPDSMTFHRSFGYKRSASRGSLPSEPPVKKKQTKWIPEEDVLIVELRGNGMKWEDISKRLPGRSAISCRLRFQNYLERRSEWTEDRKNKLAKLYDYFKKEMWERISVEMQIPWRAVESMHWQMGEADMAQRARIPLSRLVGQPSSNAASLEALSQDRRHAVDDQSIIAHHPSTRYERTAFSALPQPVPANADTEANSMNTLPKRDTSGPYLNHVGHSSSDMTALSHASQPFLKRRAFSIGPFSESPLDAEGLRLPSLKSLTEVSLPSTPTLPPVVAHDAAW